MFKRLDIIERRLEVQSQFLLGPRQTGKSTFLRTLFPNALKFDLLNQEEQRALLRDPGSLGRRVAQALLQSPHQILFVVIDEIQNQPELLNEVHRCLFEFEGRIRFILTGSSARKLRKSGVNLLGGRSGITQMFPLVWKEINSWPQLCLCLEDCLQWGSLPHILRDKVNAKALLTSYIQSYLDLEVRTEGLSRTLADFSRFLEVAALCNTQQLNYRGIGSDVGVNEKTITAWFQILEDTLLGERLLPFTSAKKRKSVASPKFYFFDCGVANAILDKYSLGKGTSEQGIALENFVYSNLKAWCHSQAEGPRLYYWRTVDKCEVDFVISKHGVPLLAIECKLSDRVSHAELKGLRAFKEEFPNCRAIIISREPGRQQFENGIVGIPVTEFLDEIWNEFTLTDV